MIKQKEKGYQGIKATEAFEYENTRSNFKYCYYWEKWKTTGIPGIQGAFSDEVTPDIACFTDGPVAQCDFQVLENTFIDYTK